MPVRAAGDWHYDPAAEYRRDLEQVLGPNWRTPMPPNPTPAQECQVWMRDAAILIAAGEIVEQKRALQRRLSSDARS